MTKILDADTARLYATRLLREGNESRKKLFTELWANYDPEGVSLFAQDLCADVLDYMDETRGSLEFRGSGRKNTVFRFACAPRVDRNDLIYGWYPRGAVSICHGSSGVGKTRLHLEIEDALRNGRSFLGTSRPPSTSLYVCLDRPIEDHYHTVTGKEGLGLSKDFVQACEFPEGQFDTDAVRTLVGIVEDYGRPELVIFEGLDALFSSTLKADILGPVLHNLQTLTKQTGIALVGTWGSPKRQSTNDRYHNTRDAAVGNAMLARRVTTMVGLAQEYEKGTRGYTDRKPTGRILVSVDSRGKPRRYILRFNDKGRMEECHPIELSIGSDEEVGFVEAQERARRILEMSKTEYYRQRKGIKEDR